MEKQKSIETINAKQSRTCKRLGLPQQSLYYWVECEGTNHLVKHPFYKKIKEGLYVPKIDLPYGYCAAYTEKELRDIAVDCSRIDLYYNRETKGFIHQLIDEFHAKKIAKIQGLLQGEKSVAHSSCKHSTTAHSIMDLFHNILNYNHNGNNH